MKISALGINKGKIRQFNSKGIFTIDELITFLPREYYDFRTVTKISDVKDSEYYSIVGKIINISSGPNHIRATVEDNSNKKLFVTWFNQKYILKSLKVGETYNFAGKIEIDKKYYSTQMLNPMFFNKNLNKYRKIIPIYSKIEGMSNDYLLRSINTALALVDKSETLENDTLKEFNLISRKKMLESIHQPETLEDIETSKERLLFEDLYKFALMLHEESVKVNNSTSIKLTEAETISKFIDSLPFNLTNDQLGITRNIFTSFRDKKRVNALVQGDVGSGKTMIAFMLMLIASENRYQSVLMAPTNVLAKQHYEELLKIAKKMGYKITFLSGELTAKQRRDRLKDIKEGNIDMIVGTHAVLSEDVEFNRLSLIIVDEEHKFGVIQRNKLTEQNNIHQITMSATPIPRSLALTIYGDNIDVYNINELPAGRKKIKTALIKDNKKGFNFIKQEVDKGRQAYIVCPLINKSDSDVMKGVLSVNEIYNDIKKYFKNDKIKIELISGNMKQKEIADIILKYTNKEIDILISTTIIEVGVNIPNSTVMMIQNAERFGLAQLHQLRGRVGRGNHQSYCILVSEDIENKKLKAMTETTDGFKIAQVDLEIRGAGEFLGTRQSGDNKYIMLMLSNQNLFNEIRKNIKTTNKKHS